ncbi:hypothetical protein LINPERPRIM_LOCUS5023 [Linum perenne]
MSDGAVYSPGPGQTMGSIHFFTTVRERIMSLTFDLLRDVKVME